MFAFNHHPTAIGVVDGLTVAFASFQVSWRKWLPVVGLVFACIFVTYSLVTRLDFSALYHTDAMGKAVWNSDALSKLPGPVTARLVDAIASAMAGWFFCATAIAGLRKEAATLSSAIESGILSLFAGLLVVVTGLFVSTVLLMAAFAVGAIIPPLGLLLLVLILVAAIPVAVYFLVRLAFTTLAIFDGFGPIGGLQESWRLSEGSVSRMCGWGTLAVVVTIAVTLGGWLILEPFSSPWPLAIAEGVAAGLSVAGSGFVTFLLAVLYESERARREPDLYPVDAWPGYGPEPDEPYEPGPYPARPYITGPYTAGPYAGDPYPADPAAMPGWVAPGPAPAWPAAPYAGPGPYPPDPSAMAGPAPAWAANPAQPAALGPAGPGPDPDPMRNSDETEPTQQPPNATPPPEAPAP